MRGSESEGMEKGLENRSERKVTEEEVSVRKGFVEIEREERLNRGMAE